MPGTWRRAREAGREAVVGGAGGGTPLAELQREGRGRSAPGAGRAPWDADSRLAHPANGVPPEPTTNAACALAAAAAAAPSG